MCDIEIQGAWPLIIKFIYIGKYQWADQGEHFVYYELLDTRFLIPFARIKSIFFYVYRITHYKFELFLQPAGRVMWCHGWRSLQTSRAGASVFVHEMAEDPMSTAKSHVSFILPLNAAYK